MRTYALVEIGEELGLEEAEDSPVSPLHGLVRSDTIYVLVAKQSTDVEGQGGEKVGTLHTKRALTALAAAGVLTALLFGSVTAAQATPVSRANAVRAAKNYLRVSAFSFKGLVGQLKYEGYSTSDARYGASHSGANWMNQAVRKARQYLKVSAFSRSGMIGQLEYDGFTHAQAVHGALGVGL